MEFTIDWNAVCLVCLQEGEMRSIYEKDEKDMSLCDKIMHCSNIEIQRGMNLPEQICSQCIDDLSAAYRFRTNCESSNVILKSFVDAHVVTDLEIPAGNGQVYKYKPPTGLNVKRIRTTPIELKVEEDISVEESVSCNEADEHFVTNEGIDHDYDDEDEKPLSVYRGEEKYTTEAVGVEMISTDFLTPLKTDKNEIEEEESKMEIQEEIICKTVAPPKRGRRKKHIFKENLEKVVTLENVSSLVNNLTTVAYVQKSRQDGKPMKICEICGNSYKYQHALESHMRRHRNEKPFSCEFCDRAFVANVELRRHMRVHTGQKPYACNYCSRRFSDFGSRIKHERTHTGERPYECSTCGKAFAYAHVLSVHILTHTGEKKFKCEICGRGFTKKVYLKSHMARHDETYVVCDPQRQLQQERQVQQEKDQPNEIEPQDPIDILNADFIPKIEVIEHNKMSEQMTCKKEQIA